MSEHFGLQPWKARCTRLRHRAELPVSVGTLLRHWEPGPSGSPGWAPGLRRRPKSLHVVRFARPPKQQPGPKSGSLIHVVLMRRGIGSAGVALTVWSVVFWPAPTSKHCQPAAASTRPDDDDDDDDHNAAASTTTTRRRRRVTSQSQVSDAGGRVAEHDDG